MTEIIIALDTPSIKTTAKIITETFAYCWGFKIGPQLFYPNYQDPAFNEYIIRVARNLFFDMKFHDIPETVAGAIRGISNISPRMFTIHSLGGYKMMKAAVDERDKVWPDQNPKPMVVAVTILTSINNRVWERMINVPQEYILENLLDEVVYAGVDAVVCSGKEVGRIKDKYPHLKTIVPGTRSLGAKTHDQARVVTPREAVDAGADYLVIGREVTEAFSPTKTLKKILDSL